MRNWGPAPLFVAAQGKPIGPNDILIAATARAYDVVLVTYNTGEFSRVTGLRLEDWEIESLQVQHLCCYQTHG
ncbi:PIN domain-containing protein [Methyloprofundus sedimenti]|uniref:PIN domain-containing protein n=1 Tax=Methyloprofundus sedimenti TaxID=1420851 RepID=UPI002FCDE4E3